MSVNVQFVLFKVYSEPNKRLSVNWRPDDAFCKPAFGERISTTNLLMKVKRRPKKEDSSKYEYQVEVLGIIDTAYRFNGNSLMTIEKNKNIYTYEVK